MSFVAKFDVFGRGVNLNVKRKSKNSTLLGGVCSIIAVGVIFVQFGFYL